MPGNGQALIGMPVIETLDVLTINCYVIDTQTQNEQRYNKKKDESQCTNKMLEAGKLEKVNVNITGIPNSDSKDNATVIDKSQSIINYLIAGSQQEADKGARVEITHKNYIKSSVMYALELGVLMAHSHCRQNQKLSHTMAPKHVAYALQKPFKEELEWLQQCDIITKLDIKETMEWCNSFV